MQIIKRFIGLTSGGLNSCSRASDPIQAHCVLRKQHHMFTRTNNQRCLNAFGTHRSAHRLENSKLDVEYWFKLENNHKSLSPLFEFVLRIYDKACTA